MFWRNLSKKRRVILVIIILVELGGYLIYRQVFTNSVNRQYQRDQELYIRVQSDISRSFFEVFSKSLASFSKLSAIENIDSTTHTEMDDYVDWWDNTGLVGGIIYTNDQGEVLFNSNALRTHDIGRSVADRDYFEWAKSQTEEGVLYVGKPVISRIGVTRGELIIPVSTVVFQDGKFEGVIVASVRLKLLMLRYVELLKTTESTEVYLLDENEVVLYSSSNFDVLDSDIEYLLGDNLKSVINNNKKGSFRTGKYIGAYSSLHLENQGWIILMLTPTSDTVHLGLVDPYVRTIGINLLILLTVALYLYVNRFN